MSDRFLQEQETLAKTLWWAKSSRQHSRSSFAIGIDIVPGYRSNYGLLIPGITHPFTRQSLAQLPPPLPVSARALARSAGRAPTLRGTCVLQGTCILSAPLVVVRLPGRVAGEDTGWGVLHLYSPVEVVLGDHSQTFSDNVGVTLRRAVSIGARRERLADLRVGGHAPQCTALVCGCIFQEGSSEELL